MSRKRKNKKNYQSMDAGREWFDKDYPAKEVYRRLWKFARPYKALIFAGMFLGMVTGGAWAPLFAVIQPMVAQLQMSGEQVEEPAVEPAVETVAAPSTPATQKASKLERQAAEQTAKYNRQIKQAEKMLGRLGIHATTTSGDPRLMVMVLLVLIMGAAMAVKMIATYLNQYYLTKAGMKVVVDVKDTMFTHLQNQSLAFHGRSDVGKLMSRATGDPATIQGLIASTMGDICRAPFEILTAVGFVCWFSIQNHMVSLLLLVIFGYPLCMLPVVYIGKQIRKWSTRLMEQGAGIGSNFHENLTCIRVVKAYHTEDTEINHYKEYNLRALKMCLRSVRLSILVGPVTEAVAIMLAGVFIAICFATGRSLADIIPLIPPFLILYKPMKQLGKIQNALENGRAALNRIFSLLDVHEEIVEKPDALRITEFRDRIEFDHVDFSYTATGEKVVKDSSFVIRRGQMFAIVGSTGSGKTTLANLLARFYDVTGGCIRVDGHDLRDYRIMDLRNIIGAVTQESVLFNDTIAANIAYGSPAATMEQIMEAARLANAHTFIMEHREGYNRIVGEKGFVLSGGERQRVAIARAILRNPPILILDEATSALDTVTEQQVQAAINNLMQNRTIFAIAHRLSTIQKADCILVVDRGEIKERGTHEELYGQGGIYRHLCDIQYQQNEVS